MKPRWEQDRELAEQVSRSIAKQTEETIIEQLKDMIDTGVLVVEYTQPRFSATKDLLFDEYKVHLSHGVRVKLRDQERFDELLAENKALKAKLAAIKEALT